MTATILRLENTYSPGDIDFFFERRNISDIEARMDEMRAVLRSYGTAESVLTPDIPLNPRFKLVQDPSPTQPEVLYEQMAYTLARNNVLRDYSSNFAMRMTLLDALDDLPPIDGRAHAHLRRKEDAA